MRRCQRQRLSACVTVAALLALLGVGWVSAPPVAAQSLPAVAAAALGLTSPTFLPDGAHLAPGVTLRLAALGRGDAFTPVDTVTPIDDGTRAEYAHGDVTEWYLRQGGGIEQGITLAAPPVGDGPLVLTIATPGAAVLVSEAGDAATLILPDKTRWQYDGLHVTDATGQVLPSRLTQAADGGIGITADDTGAVYPVTVDPFVQQQTFSEPAPATNNAFGSAVAMSADGTTLAIGAPYTSGTFQGRAYVFVRSGSGSSYGPPLTLSAPGAATGDSFGNAMALNADGSTLVVGAYGTSSFQGKAYVFNRSGGVYSSSQTLSEPGAAGNDQFGFAVSLNADGNTLIVGADNTSSFQGKAYVFTRTGIGSSYGTTPQTLSEPVAAGGDQFGFAVALSADGNTLVVGASGTTSSQGKAYVFTRTGIGSSYGTPPQTLSEPGAAGGDQFGFAVALSADGNTLAVGAPYTSSQGKAYVFARSGNTFGTPRTLIEPAAVNSDNFGYAIAISTNGGTLAVGAYGVSIQQGKVYVFARNGSGSGYGTPQAITNPTGTNGERFGVVMALSADGGALAVGADGTSSFQGAAYVFTAAPALTADSATTNQSATVGTAFATPLAAHVTDGYGNLLAGVPVRFVAAGTGVSGTFACPVSGCPVGTSVSANSLTATVTSDANGLAVAPAFTANTAAGNYTVNVSVTTTGGAATALFSLTNLAGAAAHITAFDGNGQSAVLGASFTTPLQAQVRDSHGNPVSGATVTFTAPAGSSVPTVTFPGGVATITATTDSSGVAAVTATASGRPGTLTVTASVTGVSSPASFGLVTTAAQTTLALTGFSPPTGPTSGGTSVTVRGLNLAGTTAVSVGGTAATSFSVATMNNVTVLTITAPAHAAGTVDITVTTATQTATIHGYTYLDTGSIAPQPQPSGHPPAGNIVGGSGITPMAQPGRR